MIPFTAPSKPLRESRVALITTAALHLDDQPPGDSTFRRIPADVDLMRLRTDWDGPASQDINCAFPLALLREMCGVAETHYSLNGGAIPEEAVPQLVRELDADAVLIAPS